MNFKLLKTIKSKLLTIVVHIQWQIQPSLVTRATMQNSALVNLKTRIQTTIFRKALEPKGEIWLNKKTWFSSKIIHFIKTYRFPTTPITQLAPKC